MSAAVRADVVRTSAEVARLEREPLLVLEPLEAWLDAEGLGDGPIAATKIGGGHSNVTFLLRRGEHRLVLRRPPRGPLPPSAHDVVREARLLRALRHGGMRVPDVLAVCGDASIIGAPFFVMTYIDGCVVAETEPRAFTVNDRARISDELVDALVDLHAVDVERDGLRDAGRGSGYLERQVRRFRELLARNATRALPDLEWIGDRLAATVPPQRESTVVHGDYRLGNVMFARTGTPRLLAVLDWEMATLGDPLADLGYLTAMWAEPDDEPNPMLALSAATRAAGFADRAALVSRYAERSGRAVSGLAWYQALALWKAAIFLEGSYRRFLAGTTDDPYFARLGEGVPALARAARARLAGS